MSFLIKLENISKTYLLAERQVPALKGINFTLQRGELVAIIGSSGSGKSTLMNILGLLDQCTSGRYLFADEDISHLAKDKLALIRNQKIGFIFQSFYLLPRLNALENVMLPLFYRGIPRRQAEQSAREMLDKMQVGALHDHRPTQLSGGQQQRVAIARALIGEPEVILADEATGALDSRTSHEVMDLLIHLNRHERRTIVIITHDREVSQRCQRVVTIKDGREQIS